MRWSGFWLMPLATVLLAFACERGSDADDQELVHPPPTLLELPDGGAPGLDGGERPPWPDGGEDGGEPVGPIELPEAAGWQLFGPQHGGPRRALGISADAAGNVWVAGGEDGLFLLTPGATELRQFTLADGLSGNTGPQGPRAFPVISVAGGPANTVFVGYRGIDSGGNDEKDPLWMQKTGDADKVVWNGAGLEVTHFDISSPPGMYSQYPEGREKVRHIYRILHDPKTGNVWFGGNHGVAMYEARGGTIWEHQHAHINGYKQSEAEDPTGASLTMLSGDWWGIGLDPAGDFWLGGGHRVARLTYGTSGNKFWATVEPSIDVWPDAAPPPARPHLRTDDLVSDLAVGPGGEVWVGSGNGLARIDPGAWTTTFFPAGQLVDPKVTALERDPKDGSLWVGHLWGGITRLRGGAYLHYSREVFGKPVIDMEVRDLQSDTFAGSRRILVAFSGGVVGIYTGD